MLRPRVSMGRCLEFMVTTSTRDAKVGVRSENN